MFIKLPCSQRALILVLEHVGNFGVRLHPVRSARFVGELGGEGGKQVCPYKPGWGGREGSRFVGELGGEGGKQVVSTNEESQVRGCYNITFYLYTNQETVSVLEKTQENKHLEHESKCKV